MRDYGPIIIGSGLSGRAAAIQAGKLKHRVLDIARKDRLGGVSVHTGTIPSKTLREMILNLSGWRECSFYRHSSRVKEDIEVGRMAGCHALDTPTLPESPWFPYEVGVARFCKASCGHIVGLEHRMLKILFYPKICRALWVQIMGEGATELIHIAQAVLNLKDMVNYFAKNTFNYPPLAEAYKIGGLDAFNRMPFPEEYKVRCDKTGKAT